MKNGREQRIGRNPIRACFTGPIRVLRKKNSANRVLARADFLRLYIEKPPYQAAKVTSTPRFLK